MVTSTSGATTWPVDYYAMHMINGAVIDTDLTCSCIFLYLRKSKSVSLEAWSGPEDSRKLRFPDFMTTAQRSGKVVSLTHRPHLPPGNSPGTHFC